MIRLFVSSLAVLFSLFCSSLTFAQSADPVLTLKAQELYGNTPKTDYELPVLNLVILDHSGWTLSQTQELALETAQIYLQCSLRIDEVQFHLISAPQGRTIWQKFTNQGENSLAALRSQTPILSGIVAYFIERLTDDDGKALDTTGFSNATWRNTSVVRPELQNSLYLTNLVNSDAYQKERVRSSYNILAHEMLHILSRFGGHYNLPEKNLLNVWQNRTNHILPDHCNWVHESDLIRVVQ